MPIISYVCQLFFYLGNIIILCPCHRKSLSEADYQKYNRQFQLTSNICQEFEAETAESGEAEKKERFERVMASMQVT